MKGYGKGRGKDGSHRGRARAKDNYGSSARVDESDAKSFGHGGGDGKQFSPKKKAS